MILWLLRRLWLIVGFFIAAMQAQDGAWRIQQLAHRASSYNFNDVWAWYDSLSGRTLAFAGTTRGTYIFDITTPSNPVQIAWVPGPTSIWRDMKTWKDHLFIVHDLTNDPPAGIQIVNLRKLIDSNQLVYWTFNPDGNGQYHNIFIDEKGRAWLWGAGNVNLVVDVSDPANLTLLGQYAPSGQMLDPYIHDGYVRNDTVWGGHIYSGYAVGAVVDAALNIQVFGMVQTPFRFTHNVWLSDDGRWLLTTDERSAAPVAIYDVRDPSSPQLVAQMKSSRHPDAIPHNVFYYNGYAYVSYYTEGVVVFDVRDPSLPVEVAWFDTSPYEGDGFHGCWGVFPFLPDQRVVATDIENGFYVLQGTWFPASRLYVLTRDALTQQSLSSARIEVRLDTFILVRYADLNGFAKFAFPDTGRVTITIKAVGYHDTTVVHQLRPGAFDTLQIDLRPALTASSYASSPNECRLLSSYQLQCPSARKVHVYLDNGQLLETTGPLYRYYSAAPIRAYHCQPTGCWLLISYQY